MNKQKFTEFVTEIQARLNHSTEQQENEWQRAQQILDLSDQYTVEEQIEAWLVVAEVGRLKQDLNRVEVACLTVIDLLQTFDDDALIDAGFSLLDSVAYPLSNYSVGRKMMYNAKEAALWEKRGHWDKIIRSLNSSIYYSNDSNNYEKAHYLHLIALQPHHDLCTKAIRLRDAGIKLSQIGCYQQAVEVFEEALQNLKIIAVDRGVGQSPIVEDLAGLYWVLGNETALEKMLEPQWLPWQLRGRRISESLLPKLGRLSPILNTALGKNIAAELVPALGDERIDNRRAIAWMIGECGDVSTLPTLLALYQEGDEVTQERVLTALGVLGATIEAGEAKATIVQTLVQALYNTSLLIRWAAVIALRQIAPEDIPELRQALSTDSLATRQAATSVISKTNDQAAIPQLLTNLTISDCPLRVITAKALGNLKATAAIPHLVTHLNDTEVRVRMACVVALGRIGHPEAIPALTNLLETTRKQEDGEFNKATLVGKREEIEAIVWAFGEIGHEAALPALIDMLSSQENYSYNMMNALIKIGKPSVPYLIELLEHKKEAFYKEQKIFAVIAQVGGASVIPQMRWMLFDDLKLPPDRRRGPYYYISAMMGQTAHEEMITLIMEALQARTISKETAIEMLELARADDAIVVIKRLSELG